MKNGLGKVVIVNKAFPLSLRTLFLNIFRPIITWHKEPVAFLSFITGELLHCQRRIVKETENKNARKCKKGCSVHCVQWPYINSSLFIDSLGAKSGEGCKEETNIFQFPFKRCTVNIFIQYSAIWSPPSARFPSHLSPSGINYSISILCNTLFRIISAIKSKCKQNK